MEKKSRGNTCGVGLGEGEGGTEQSMGVQSAFRMHLPLSSGMAEASLSSRQPNHHTRVPQTTQNCTVSVCFRYPKIQRLLKVKTGWFVLELVTFAAVSVHLTIYK